MTLKTQIQKLFVCAVLFGAVTLAQAQFSYTDNGDGTCTITGYTGSGGAVVIPDTTNNLTVTGIGFGAFMRNAAITSVMIPNSVTNIEVQAFYECSNLTTVSVPASVTSIGVHAFSECFSMTAISVNATNLVYSSTNGVLFDKNQTTLIQFPCGQGGGYNIPNSVTNIRLYAFLYCTNLTSISIPNSVTDIGNSAFLECSHLTGISIPNSVTSVEFQAFAGCRSLTNAIIGSGVTSIGPYAFGWCDNLTYLYFQGNAPNLVSSNTFYLDSQLTIYYLPGTTGWYGSTFGGRPAVLWNPQATTFSVTADQFGFNITGPSSTVIVVEACTNLGNPVWLPVSTNALDGSGASSFSDSQSGNYPVRFYRFRSP